MHRTAFMIASLLVATAAILAACGPQGDRTRPAEEVVWLEGQAWDEIVALAGERDRPILVDFYATWCGPCKLLDDSVYVAPEVVEELSGLVTFKVDVDRPEYAGLKEEFKIFSMPTLVLCRPDGSEIDRFLGYRPAPLFLETVRDYLAGRNTLADVESRLAAQPDDPELLLTAGRKHALRLDEAPARAQLGRVIEAGAGDPARLAPALEALAELEWKLGNHDAAIATYRRLMAECPGTREADSALAMVAYCQRRQGDTEAMVATYREMVALAPEDVSALNRFAWNAAQAGVALEEATDMALKAVTLSDDDPGVMDTLAEVYYARGMFTEAIDCIQQAIAKEPDDNYLQEQLAKFERAAQGGQP